MQLLFNIGALSVGLAAAVATHFLLAGLLPGWLAAGCTALVAMLPGLTLHYLLVQRELRLLTTELACASEPGRVRECRIDAGRLRNPDLRALAEAFAALQSSLVEITRGIAERGGNLAISAAKLSFSADTLQHKLKEQVTHSRSIGSTTQQILETTQRMAKHAEQARLAAAATLQAGNQGRASVQGSIERIHGARTEAESNAGSLTALQARSEEIQNITHIIDQVAEQTNLLALNAAIEAARAGEHGRGFAVVADEVRQLASKTSEATREIGEKLVSIHQEVNHSVDAMGQLVATIERVVTDTEQVGGILVEITEHSEQAKQGISLIADAVQSHVTAIDEISGALGEVEQALSVTEAEVQQASEGALSLSDTAEQEYSAIAHFELDTVHDRMRHVAQQTAREIGRVFEQAVQAGRLSMADLLDRQYQPIEGTDPVKYRTRFDQFTDAVLPDIQEPILQQHPFVLYAGAVDDNGYFPTHNKRYSQPLTGDYATDLSNNRTKRIFGDRTGSRCGSSSAPFLLQTYKRDTGEIMHDMSAPIHVAGRHWGGFRIGYKSESG
jgi:methyl-accepting chemotaxis protein